MPSLFRTKRTRPAGGPSIERLAEDAATWRDALVGVAVDLHPGAEALADLSRLAPSTQHGDHVLEATPDGRSIADVAAAYPGTGYGSEDGFTVQDLHLRVRIFRDATGKPVLVLAGSRATAATVAAPWSPKLAAPKLRRVEPEPEFTEATEVVRRRVLRDGQGNLVRVLEEECRDRGTPRPASSPESAA